MCIGDVVGTRVENILYFSKQGLLGSMGGRTFGNVGKVPKKKSFEAIGAKMDIIKALNIQIYEGEIKYHILEIMVAKMIL